MNSKLCHNIRLLVKLKFIQLIFYTLSGSKLGNNKYSKPEKTLVVNQSVNRHLNETSRDNLCFYWLVNEKFSSEFGTKIMKFFEGIIMWLIVPSADLALRHKHIFCAWEQEEVRTPETVVLKESIRFCVLHRSPWSSLHAMWYFWLCHCLGAVCYCLLVTCCLRLQGTANTENLKHILL